MNQDNMDDRIRDIFDSLDEQDLSAAQESKEHIWSMIQPEKQEKKTNQWWLLLLLGGLLFTAGWFLSPNQLNESAAKQQQRATEQSGPDADLKLALNKANSFLSSQQKSLDSLQALNASLSDRLLVELQNNPVAVQQTEEDQIILRDTIYLTQVKVEQRVIEKVIRDTIILEVPSIEAMEPMADVNQNITEERIGEEPKAKISALPSSVQFNFSETNHIDK